MRRKLVMLLAVSLFAFAAPALAGEVTHGQDHDAECARECALLLRECGQEVDSLQDRIRKLQVVIDEKGASAYTKEELTVLKRKLAEANETVRVLTRH